MHPTSNDLGPGGGHAAAPEDAARAAWRSDRGTAAAQTMIVVVSSIVSLFILLMGALDYSFQSKNANNNLGYAVFAALLGIGVPICVIVWRARNNRELTRLGAKTREGPVVFALGALVIASISLVPNLVVAVQRAVDQAAALAHAAGLDPLAIEGEAVDHVTALAQAIELDIAEGPIVDRPWCTLAGGADGEQRSAWIRGHPAAGVPIDVIVDDAVTFWTARGFEAGKLSDTYARVNPPPNETFVEISIFSQIGDDGLEELMLVYESDCMPTRD